MVSCDRLNISIHIFVLVMKQIFRRHFHFNRHCDTPYNNAKFREWQRDSASDAFPDVHKPLGVQCNLCVDEYTAENGGTMFVPNSWALGRQPPAHFNDGMPQHPSVPRDARQMLAPAGTLLMYHAATYHRLHVNVSNQPRIGASKPLESAPVVW